MPDIPKPPDTPPRGGAHLHVDTASMAERAIDKAGDAKKIAMHADDRSAEALQLSLEHAKMIERLPAIETKLDLALRPRPVHPVVQGAVAVGAVIGAFAMVVLAIAVVTLVRTPIASAASSGQGTQAVYRVP